MRDPMLTAKQAKAIVQETRIGEGLSKSKFDALEAIRKAAEEGLSHTYLSRLSVYDRTFLAQLGYALKDDSYGLGILVRVSWE